MSYNLPESKEGCNMALEHINNSDFLPGYELEFDVKNASVSVHVFGICELLKLSVKQNMFELSNTQ
jgi:hypothetical protein